MAEDPANKRVTFGPTAKLVTGAIVAVSVGLAIPLYFARPKGLPPSASAAVKQSTSPATLLTRSPKTLLSPRATLQQGKPSLWPTKQAPKQLSQREMEAMGFNPALYTFGAFGVATILVWVSAALGVGIIQSATGAQSLDEFSAYMRTAIGQKLPDLQDRLYRPPDDEDNPINDTPSLVDNELDLTGTEKRLSDAFEKGGLTAWAAQAFHELERERKQAR